MKKTLTGRLSAGVATVAAVLVVAVPSHAALTAPVPEGPADGASVAALPAFSWTPVAGAERYEFQIAADPAFNSPVLGSNFDRFFTRNTSATLVKAVPNGSYWWRVRAVTGAGSVSPGPAACPSRRTGRPRLRFFPRPRETCSAIRRIISGSSGPRCRARGSTS